MKDKKDKMEELLASVTRNGKAQSYLQLRSYDIQDNLVYKGLFSCSDYLKLCQRKDDYFTKKTTTRCTVRYLDARRLDWSIVITARNRQARTFDPKQTAAQKWKIAYYDAADEIHATEVSDRIFKFDTVILNMRNQNAPYSVLSACEAGAPEEHFQVFCFIENEYFQPEVDVDGRLFAPPTRPSIVLFQEAFLRDLDETIRLVPQLRVEYWVK